MDTEDDIFAAIRKRIADIEAERDEAQARVNGLCDSLRKNRIIFFDGKAYCFIRSLGSFFNRQMCPECPLHELINCESRCAAVQSGENGRYYDLDDIRAFFIRELALARRMSSICDEFVKPRRDNNQ